MARARLARSRKRKALARRGSGFLLNTLRVRPSFLTDLIEGVATDAGELPHSRRYGHGFFNPTGSCARS
jgi:hypothetical protein